MSKNELLQTNICLPKEGELPVKMTNDLLFHYLLQDTESTSILKGIISSFYEIPFNNIKSAIVENPIAYGEALSSKTMILDVKTLLNNDQIINLEMQVINYKDYPERSISYLCRCFDNLQRGQGYSFVKGAYHIGFLDYTLFPENPGFYATYTIRDTLTNYTYSSKFGISVINLNSIDMATVEDKRLHRHLWASFFKATTWEEINMLIAQDIHIRDAAIKLHQISENQKLRDEIWAREDQLRRENDRNNYYESEIARITKEFEEYKRLHP